MIDGSGFLLAQHRMAGLSLNEYGQREMVLKHGDRIIQIFDQHTKIEEIRAVADDELNKIASGISFGEEVSNG